MQEAIPSGTPAGPQRGGEKKTAAMLLPREEEMQHNVTMIMNRFLFCLTSVRSQAFRAGFVPVFLDLSLSRTIRVRQNAASCVFYMSLDADATEEIGTPACKGIVEKLLQVLSATPDMLVRLTMLRTLKQLIKLDANLEAFYHAGVVDLYPTTHARNPQHTPEIRRPDPLSTHRDTCLTCYCFPEAQPRLLPRPHIPHAFTPSPLRRSEAASSCLRVCWCGC